MQRSLSLAELRKPLFAFAASSPQPVLTNSTSVSKSCWCGPSTIPGTWPKSVQPSLLRRKMIGLASRCAATATGSTLPTAPPFSSPSAQLGEDRGRSDRGTGRFRRKPASCSEPSEVGGKFVPTKASRTDSTLAPPRRSAAIACRDPNPSTVRVVRRADRAVFSKDRRARADRIRCRTDTRYQQP